MLINPDLCVGCGNCAIFCPVGAIVVDRDHGTAKIDFDECVECGNCLRQANCQKNALYQQALSWPRIIRSNLSDPLTITVESGIAGRGTEEMKTNDVTGRFKKGQVGIGIEMGRPILGAWMKDVEKVAMAVAGFGVEFETCNPLTSLMQDRKTGQFKQDLLKEKVLSAIIEFALPIEKVSDLLKVLKDVAKEIDTVFSLCLASIVNADGNIPAFGILDEAGYGYAPNGKTNVGLGRPLFKEN